MILYVVEMLRWGNRENHSYVIGVYTDHDKAKEAGEVEESWRGGKYEYVITEHELDAVIDEERLKHYRLCHPED